MDGNIRPQLRRRLGTRRSLMTAPDRPWCIAPVVNSIKILLLLEGIHTCPKTLVRERHQLAFSDEAAERFLDQFFSVMHIVEDLLAQDHEATVHPRTGLADVIDALYDSVGTRGS